MARGHMQCHIKKSRNLGKKKQKQTEYDMLSYLEDIKEFVSGL